MLTRCTFRQCDFTSPDFEVWGFLVVARFLIQLGTAKIRKVLKMEIKQVNLDICDNEGYSRYSYL